MEMSLKTCLSLVETSVHPLHQSIVEAIKMPLNQSGTEASFQQVYFNLSAMEAPV